MPRARLLAVMLLFGFTACQPAPAPSNPVRVISAEFGLFDGEDGRYRFMPATSVPLIADQQYGWVVEINTSKPTVKWREEFTLPSAPAIWNLQTDEGQTLSPDQTTSVVEREVVPDGDILSNVWTVAAGDPKGRYILRVTIEQLEPIVFEFNVE